MAADAAALPDRLARPVVLALVAVALGVALAAAAWAAWEVATAPPAPAGPADPVAQLEAVVAQDPANTAARLQLGHAYFEQDRYDLALDAYLSVLQAHPDNAQALLRSGWIAFEGGDAVTAQRLLERALELRPQDPEALWYSAQVLVYGTDDKLAAVEPLKALLEREDLDPGFRRQIRDLLSRARNGG